MMIPVEHAGARVDAQTRDDGSLRELAYRQLSDLLAPGALGPGDKISLRAAAEALGVSMMPVREAVSRLVADNALEVTPNRAVRVPVMTKRQFRDLTRVRIMIEGQAAAWAATLRTQADLSNIRNIEALFRAQGLSSRPDISRAVSLNKEFHFAVYSAAQSPTLLGLINGLWLKAGPVITLDVRDKPATRLPTHGVERHRAILRAIEHRNEEEAREAVALDIQGAADYIVGRDDLPE